MPSPYEILDARTLPLDRLIVRRGSSAPLDASLAARLEAAWEAARHRTEARGAPLFDGALFRLEAHRTLASGLELTLGETSYRHYVGTRDPAANLAPELRAEPLATCIVLRTSDGRIALERRERVDVGAGRWHVVGGFPERGVDEGPAGADLAAAITRECVEETGFAPRSLRVLGFVRDRRDLHYEVCFGGELDASFQEVARDGAAREEFRAPLALEDSPRALERFLHREREAMSPTGEAALLLYGREAFGEAWYARNQRSTTKA